MIPLDCGRSPKRYAAWRTVCGGGAKQTAPMRNLHVIRTNSAVLAESRQLAERWGLWEGNLFDWVRCAGPGRESCAVQSGGRPVAGGGQRKRECTAKAGKIPKFRRYQPRQFYRIHPEYRHQSALSELARLSCICRRLHTEAEPPWARGEVLISQTLDCDSAKNKRSAGSQGVLSILHLGAGLLPFCNKGPLFGRQAR